MAEVFLTGGTGYIGRRLIPLLLEHGHSVRALVRPGSERKLPPGCIPVFGNALQQESFATQVAPAQTFIQLVGVPHPSPSKTEQFKAVDLASIRASVRAAVETGIQHFIYVSVAHPAPVMRSYIAVRSDGEALLRDKVASTRQFFAPGMFWDLATAGQPCSFPSIGCWNTFRQPEKQHVGLG